jgi:hypothetical protein
LVSCIADTPDPQSSCDPAFIDCDNDIISLDKVFVRTLTTKKCARSEGSDTRQKYCTTSQKQAPTRNHPHAPRPNTEADQEDSEIPRIESKPDPNI